MLANKTAPDELIKQLGLDVEIRATLLRVVKELVRS
jgi:hypothetical protein